jgi:ATP-dependent helicase/DNAse subunit B
VVFDNNTNSYIEQVLRGYKKTIARKKHEGIMPTKEGKKLLEFDAHAAVCRVMVELQPNRRRHTNSESAFFYGVYEDLVFNLYKKRPARRR